MEPLAGHRTKHVVKVASPVPTTKGHLGLFLLVRCKDALTPVLATQQAAAGGSSLSFVNDSLAILHRDSQLLHHFHHQDAALLVFYLTVDHFLPPSRHCLLCPGRFRGEQNFCPEFLRKGALLVTKSCMVTVTGAFSRHDWLLTSFLRTTRRSHFRPDPHCPRDAAVFLFVHRCAMLPGREILAGVGPAAVWVEGRASSR